ncbi:MAG: dienelactone hydrolase family protein [Proteobacteria bacterium]|nr:dienelactone hydrolase family protein [Pseudomonadota bacterium]
MALSWIVAEILLLLCFSTSALAQDAATKQIAARTELHSIPTLTLSDEQFLKGDAGGKETVVSGHFRIAQGSGRLPVVVLIHGSGGMGSNIDLWTREFNEMGISTFALDGFTGRGLTSVNTNQALLGRLNMILDAYRTLDILAKHPRVDPSRIALMGFSRGGQAALFASLKRFNMTWNKSGIEFAAYIPFYPDCMTSYISDTEVADRPIRIFHGTPDDYNPVTACKTYLGRLSGAGRDVQLTEYPNAAHSFDSPLASLTPVAAKGAQTVRNCRIVEEKPGQLLNAATKQPFTYKDTCVELDPHVGYDPSATQSAKDSIRGLLKTVLRLN